MSKKSKAKSQLRRKKEKAARKAAQQAKYEGFKKAGINTKSKRNKLSSKREQRLVRSVRHANGRCYNVGCSTCQPPTFESFKRHTNPADPFFVRPPHRVWLAIQRQAF